MHWNKLRLEPKIPDMRSIIECSSLYLVINKLVRYHYLLFNFNRHPSTFGTRCPAQACSTFIQILPNCPVRVPWCQWPIQWLCFHFTIRWDVSVQPRCCPILFDSVVLRAAVTHVWYFDWIFQLFPPPLAPLGHWPQLIPQHQLGPLPQQLGPHHQHVQFTHPGQLCSVT